LCGARPPALVARSDTLEFSDGVDVLALLSKFDAAFNLLYRDHRGRDACEPITSRSRWDMLI
jgi:hypothetical protein